MKHELTELEKAVTNKSAITQKEEIIGKIRTYLNQDSHKKARTDEAVITSSMEVCAIATLPATFYA